MTLPVKIKILKNRYFKYNNLIKPTFKALEAITHVFYYYFFVKNTYLKNSFIHSPFEGPSPAAHYIVYLIFSLPHL
jgi:hypothetical protein